MERALLVIAMAALGSIPSMAAPEVRKAFEELHWSVRVEPAGAAARISELSLAEGPAAARPAGLFQLVEQGPVQAPVAGIGFLGETGELPLRPGLSGFRLISGTRDIDRRSLTPELVWRAYLKLAMSAPGEKPEPDRTSQATLARLEALATVLERAGPAPVVIPLRLKAERELCPDLRRFDDASARLADPCVERPVDQRRPLPRGPLSHALHRWLATGDRSALASAWQPWRRHVADRGLWYELENVTLCRLSRRVESLLATSGPADPAGKLRALEALLLLARYEPIDRD